MNVNKIKLLISKLYHISVDDINIIDDNNGRITIKISVYLNKLISFTENYDESYSESIFNLTSTKRFKLINDLKHYFNLPSKPILLIDFKIDKSALEEVKTYILSEIKRILSIMTKDGLLKNTDDYDIHIHYEKIRNQWLPYDSIDFIVEIREIPNDEIDYVDKYLSNINEHPDYVGDARFTFGNWDDLRFFNIIVNCYGAEDGETLD